ncbi:hypothetical protein DM860_011279 [Cuscuta australis]|uniref:Lysine-specific demethylase REF6 n=1 Tax=Cuscuta australis TaxID=267555 RepID=A0A328DTV7_9ASTE|nr:hypothetical protein DM860_011279 [Cuscuta australis]
MSPEVLLNAGVPCCRLVQDVGDFVVTFPRAYHSGFSHGFNCGEASNIATPGWLRVAKDAAIRRASINCPPMVSHFQLLYDLAISLCSSMSKNIRVEPRSSRLKDKKKDEGEALVKDFFIQDLKQTNSLLHTLGGGSSVVLLHRNSTNLQGSPLKIKPENFSSVGFLHHEVKPTKDSGFENVSLGRKQRPKQTPGVLSNRGKSSPLCESSRLTICDKDYNVQSSNGNTSTSERAYNCDRSSDHGLFSCVTCGILCYTCVAIVQPTDEAAHCLISADCESIIQLRAAESGTPAVDGDTDASMLGSSSGLMVRRAQDDIFDAPIKSTNQTEVFSDERVGVVSTSGTHKDSSSLGLLASAYGDSSDSEAEADAPVKDCDGRSTVCSSQVNADVIPLHFVLDPYADHRVRRTKHDGGNRCSFGSSVDAKTDAGNNNTTSILSDISQNRLGDHVRPQEAGPNCTQFSHKPGVVKNAHVSFSDVSMQSDEDSSRMHVFCLQHAVEVEKKLRSVGGAHISLFCHPDYPQLEAEARKLAGDCGSDYVWSENSFHEATVGDKKLIRSALESQEAIHGNGDWAVKLGINLFHSASLSRSTLYCKQMAYNSVIYTAFGRSSSSQVLAPENDMVGPAKHKKVSVAGKWCGKFWMSNQVHPLLSHMASDQPDLRTNPAARFVPEQKPILLSLEGKHTPETAAPTFRKKRKSAVMENGRFLANDHPDEKPMPNHKNKQVKKEPYDEPQKIITKNEVVDVLVKHDEVEGGPSTRLRRRISKPVEDSETEPIKAKPTLKATKRKKVPLIKKVPDGNNSSTKRKAINKRSATEEEVMGEHLCDFEGCNMSFRSKQELQLHKKNICPVKGCGKNFFSHKYLVQHRRVHIDERPLKCPWKGCKMTFKWAWARTEHIRVHTGARPYLCTETGCGQTFRFVSDFSRHKRKTGHASNK